MYTAYQPAQETERQVEVPIGALALGACVVGLGMLLASILLRKRHWTGVRTSNNPTQFSAVWIDVLLQLVAALGVMILLAALLFTFLWLRQ